LLRISADCPNAMKSQRSCPYDQWSVVELEVLSLSTSISIGYVHSALTYIQSAVYDVLLLNAVFSPTVSMSVNQNRIRALSVSTASE